MSENGNGLVLNIDDLDLNEVSEIEDEFGPLGEIQWNTAKQVRFLVWIFKRRDNPDITIEEAGKQKMTALVTEDAARPTKARKGSARGARSSAKQA